MANPTLDYPITYRGLTFNRHRTAAGVEGARATLDDTIRLRRFDFSPLGIRDQVEGLHLASGSDFGPATRELRRVSITGEIIATSEAILADREAAFFSALDVEEAIRTSPDTEGASALDFYSPTAAPPPGFASPVHEMFLARPRGFPVSYEQENRGLVKMIACEWECADPYRYLYDETSVTLDASNDWSAELPNWPLGVGALTFPVWYLYFDNLAGPDIIYSVDMRTGIVYDTTNEEHSAYLILSDPDTFFGVPPGGVTVSLERSGDIPLSETITLTDGTKELELDFDRDSLTQAVVTYRMARA